MRSLAIQSLNVRGFRNLVSVDIELGPRLNVLAGDNGQGKTSLLEAAYVVATSRSFRTSKLNELVCTQSEIASVRAVVLDGDERREQSVGLKPGARVVRIDGKRPPTLAAYAVATPVVAFHPGAVALSAGASAERRRLLDRVALHESPASLLEADSYTKAARARQRVLEVRGRGRARLAPLGGAHRPSRSRSERSARGRCSEAPSEGTGCLRAPGTHRRRTRRTLRARRPDEAEAFRSALESGRTRDRARGSASVGPHRDDLVLELVVARGQATEARRSVRGMASQGQHRTIVLALELAEIEVISERRQVRPILLLDDVSSELDQGRTAALFGNLREEEGQVLLTTTRPDLIETSGLSGMEERRDFGVVAGQIRRS